MRDMRDMRRKETWLRLQALVSDITYKLNTHLSILPDGLYFVRLRLVFRVAQIDPPHHDAWFSFIELVPLAVFFDLCDEDILAQWIYPFLLRAEEHEMKEWFKYRGKQVLDPHPELGRDAVQQKVDV